MSRPWFKAKQYGWGWYPASWQGWLILFVYTVVISLAAVLLGSRIEIDAYFVGAIALTIGATIGLIIICWKTGEHPKWSWGKLEPKEWPNLTFKKKQ